MPMRSRRVRVAMLLAMVMGDDSTDRSGVKCISASQAPSKPHASAVSTSSNPSANAVAWLPARAGFKLHEHAEMHGLSSGISRGLPATFGPIVGQVKHRANRGSRWSLRRYCQHKEVLNCNRTVSLARGARMARARLCAIMFPVPIVAPTGCAIAVIIGTGNAIAAETAGVDSSPAGQSSARDQGTVGPNDVDGSGLSAVSQVAGASWPCEFSALSSR